MPSNIRAHALLLSTLLGLVGQTLSPATVLAASPYSDAVLADHPAAYWRFNEKTGGTAADASGSGHTANLSGASGNYGGALTGDTDTAFYFNGNASVQDTRTVSVGADFTIEAWIKAASATANAPVVSITTAGGGPATRTIYLDGNRFRGMADMSSNWPSFTVWSAVIDPLAWHHVVFSSQGGALRLYVDGALSGSATVASRPTFVANAIVGWSTATWLPHFVGAVDEVALYTSALPAARVTAHASVGRGQVPCPGSLQALVNAAPSGATLTVPACIFRETVTISRPLTLVGLTGAEIRGSDVWPGWTQQGATWLSQLTVPALPAVSLDPNACASGTNNRCLWPEQVFIDGRALTPVAPGTVPRAGQFALVSAADRHVRLGESPNGHLVEVTTRPRWIVTATDSVSIRNLIMRHAASSAGVGAISNDRHSNWTLQDSTLSDAHANNVNLTGGSNVRVVHNDIGRAGLAGIAGSNITVGGLIQANRIHDNSRASFNRDWGAGGLKLTVVQNFIVDGNEADHNDGIGLWCDIGCRSVTFSNNRVHHNQWQGINFEISDGARIFDNATWENGWGKTEWGWGAGIVISSSANAEVYRNTVAWNYAGISVLVQNRPDNPGPDSRGHYVHDNVIVKKTVSGDFSQTYWRNLSLAWISDGIRPMFDPSFNNRALNNRVWYDIAEDMSVRFSWSAQYRFLADFLKVPGGTGTRYMTTTEMNQALTARSMPLAPEAH